MSKNIKNLLNEFFEKANGIVSVMLIDIDGIPIESIGKFKLPPDDIGALLSASFLAYKQVGSEFGQEIINVMVEYNNLKLYQITMERGVLIIIADKEAFLGLIRLIAKRVINELSKIMEETKISRDSLMEEHKFRKPSDSDITDIMSKFG
jgi:predicted regulator of Ras-like GTPase activity (Roadblock/LC7/MglB family)